MSIRGDGVTETRHSAVGRRAPGPARAAAALLALLAASPACGRGHETVLRLSDGATVSFSEMLADLATVPLVLLGEVHDMPGHHQAQLDVIAALHAAGRPLVIGLEMFHEGHQEDLDRWVAGSIDVDDFVPVYYHNWSEPWQLYSDIFAFARRNGIPMIGLNPSPEITRQVAARGFDSLSPAQLSDLPGVTCSVDLQYEAFIRRVLGEHGTGRNFRNFCEAQMVWDNYMAMKAASYLASHRGVAMALLAGSGHAWKRGIPSQVPRFGSYPTRSVIPETEGRLTRGDATAGDADYLLLDI